MCLLILGQVMSGKASGLLHGWWRSQIPQDMIDVWRSPFQVRLGTGPPAPCPVLLIIICQVDFSQLEWDLQIFKQQTEVFRMLMILKGKIQSLIFQKDSVRESKAIHRHTLNFTVCGVLFFFSYRSSRTLLLPVFKDFLHFRDQSLKFTCTGSVIERINQIPRQFVSFAYHLNFREQCTWVRTRGRKECRFAGVTVGF